MAYPSKTNRNEIIEAALARVEREGPEALTLRRLGSEIGVTANALYRYFKSLDALFAAAADAVAQRLYLFIDKSMSALPAELSPEDRVRKLLAFYAEFAETHPSLYHVVFSAKHEAEAELPEPRWRGRLFRQSLEIVAPLVTSCDAEAATISLWSLLHGIWALRRAGVLGDTKQEEIDDYAFEGLIRGLRR